MTWDALSQQVAEALIRLGIQPPDEGIAEEHDGRPGVGSEFDVAQPEAVVLRANGARVGDDRVRIRHRKPAKFRVIAVVQ